MSRKCWRLLIIFLLVLILTSCGGKTGYCRFLPLTIGNWWLYTVSESSGNGKQSSEYHFKLTVDDHDDNYHGYEAWHIKYENADANELNPATTSYFAQAWYAYDGDTLFKYYGNQWKEIVSNNMNEGKQTSFGFFVETYLICQGKHKDENYGEMIAFSCESSGSYDDGPSYSSYQSEGYAAYIGPTGFYSDYSSYYGGETTYTSQIANLTDYYIQ